MRKTDITLAQLKVVDTGIYDMGFEDTRPEPKELAERLVADLPIVQEVLGITSGTGAGIPFIEAYIRKVIAAIKKDPENRPHVTLTIRCNDSEITDFILDAAAYIDIRVQNFQELNEGGEELVIGNPNRKNMESFLEMATAQPQNREDVQVRFITRPAYEAGDEKIGDYHFRVLDVVGASEDTPYPYSW